MEALDFNIGDVLWCNRMHYKAVMDESHIEGPYIVVKSEDGFVYAVPGKSYKPSRDDDTLRDNLLIERSATLLKRNTFFDLSNVVIMPYKKIINYIGKINDKQKNELMRKLIMQQNMGNLNWDGADEFASQIHLELGDVIEKNGKKYLVLKHKENNLVKVVPYRYREDGTPKFNFYKIEKFEYDPSYKLTFAHTDEFIKTLRIKMFIFECHKPVNHCEGIQVGSLILYNGNVYYVSEVLDSEYVCNKLEITLEKKQVFKVLGTFFKVEYADTPVPRESENIHLLYNLGEKKVKNMEGLKNNVPNPKAEDLMSYRLNYFGRIVYVKHKYRSRYALYKVVNKGIGIFVDLRMLKDGRFETKQLSFDQVLSRGSSKTTFKQYINSINVKVEDPRYEEFLMNNGIYGNIGYVNKSENHTRRRF